ncbi:RiPP maturation radical SAM C-methyltransferase [Paractinoplanes durhamensis]|uniref:RiPP maturation radical SAM protein 1 n=1 Tax=Paractinoplanes durhamensis TaxID=113563 RepID=A0ABQ3YYT0_9ACTN|nr:RiPP maturation radical SAM C-methyltransferase [Actinoplanes durhamensis]GIE02749.1 RiPP maturation radical SAM protein 1 [Actinoplanes durhamensis]
MTGAVVLVSMPFADGPSLQLGLLKPAVAAAGFPVRTLHAGLDLAARIGMPAYRQLAAHRGRMFGDWLFSVQAFGSAAPDPDGLMVSRFAADAPDLDLMKIRDAVVPEYLDALAADPVFDDATVVGFTSTFQQNVASFALARRLKARFPSLVTVFGGANFDPPMGAEYLRAMDCVDHVVSGPGEVALPELLGGTASGSAFPPDYDEYFERAERLGLLDREKVRLPFESSRGCWWGAKHHCTFCGLNGTTMAYRSKPPEQVLAELAGLARRYRTFRFDAVDNILDPAYLKTVMPALTESGYDLFYEVKANLGRAQLRLLAQAGVRRLQPGLESLSTRVLGLMRKGVRASQNVNLLRWARYYDIDVAWNLLWGFPGETAEDYRAQTELLPHLVHLQPPGSADRIWLERFSPLFTSTVSPSPEPSYRYVYPPSVDLSKAAYFFDWPDDLPPYEELRLGVVAWQDRWRTRPSLTYRWIPGLLQIRDRRGHDGTYTFPDPVAGIHEACAERPRTAVAVARELALPEETVRATFAALADRGLMFLDGDRALALALPAVAGR